jgi:hypothetical protein
MIEALDAALTLHGLAHAADGRRRDGATAQKPPRLIWSWDCGAAALVRKQRLSPRLLRALWDEHGG